LLEATREELSRRGVLAVFPRPAAPEAGLPGVGRAARLRLPSITLRLLSRNDLQVAALTAAGELALRLRRVFGRDVVDLEAFAELISFAYRASAARERGRRGLNAIDEFGFDADWAETFLPLCRLLYRRYWRVEASGAEHVPRQGGALIVANHAGVLPMDGLMIKTALFEEGVDRHARALAATWFFGLPWLSWFMRRTGQTIGHPGDTLRMLRSGELVLVFPEGTKGTGKPFSERYRLRRFGRGGFVEMALRAQVPIVPISVVGSEETYPMLADVRPLARLLGLPYFPVTPTWPWLGLLGLIPLPTKWSIRFHPPIPVDTMGPEAADDVSLVMQLADTVRDCIQQGVIAGLMDRRGVFG